MIRIFCRKPWLALIAVLCVSAGGLSAENLPPTVQAIAKGHGVQLTDVDGFTLYTFDTDLSQPGRSTCTGACAALHPPFMAKDIPADLPEGWSVIVRDDGTRQWTYEGRPLYRYARDLHPESAFGAVDGWNFAFEPLLTPAEMTVGNTVLGHVLVTAGGKTLYVQDAGGGPCDLICQKTWRPIRAPWNAHDFGAFSVLVGNDGIDRWAYDGQALYTFNGDAAAGDVNGHGQDDTWQALVLEPAPPVPDWITVVQSDGGALYANRDGMTLYRLMIDQNATEQAYIGGNHCDGACLEKYWTPVRAEMHTPPVGHWSVIEGQDGGWQWAYKGMPLYLLNLETRPGQLYYTTFRQFQWMKPVMYALPSLQGVF